MGEAAVFHSASHPPLRVSCLSSQRERPTPLHAVTFHNFYILLGKTFKTLLGGKKYYILFFVLDKKQDHFTCSSLPVAQKLPAASRLPHCCAKSALSRSSDHVIPLQVCCESLLPRTIVFKCSVFVEHFYEGKAVQILSVSLFMSCLICLFI